MNELIDHIKSVLSIPEGHLAQIKEVLVPKKFSKKEHLLQAGTYAKEVFFISRGCVRTYVHDLNGVAHNITFSMENWWCGDLQSFITETPASFHIQALEDTQVVCIGKAHWDVLLREVPEFVSYTRILFRNTMFSHENRILQNLSFTAEERYQFFLNNYPSLSQRISQKHIASYLGITPEFLSMIRGKRKG